MTSVASNQTGASAMNEAQFRSEVMPRAQLSIRACQLALDTTTLASVKEFATFELEEAVAVVAVLKDLGTASPPATADGDAFIQQLQGASGAAFDKLFIQAELSNHEFLRDLAKTYLQDAGGRSSAAERETQHIATIALFAFDEHVAICQRIGGEIGLSA